VGIISVIVGFISIGLGIASYESSNNWQKQQIPELKAQNKLLQQINESLKKSK